MDTFFAGSGRQFLDSKVGWSQGDWVCCLVAFVGGFGPFSVLFLVWFCLALQLFFVVLDVFVFLF